MKYKIQELQTPYDIQKIFFVGIKGVGMAPLALIAKEAGFEIAGSDLQEQFITDYYLHEQGILLLDDFKVEHLVNFFSDTNVGQCLVITTGAHKGFDNPQVKWAQEAGIKILTQGQALALFMNGEILGRDGMKSIAVAGSHGKTTISSLLAIALSELELNPTYAVGTGELFPLGAPGHLGSGEFFIAEADEYASEPVYDRVPKFLYQTPNYAIFNNIDFDHPDMYGSIDDIAEAFMEFANNIKSGGILFVNGDDTYLSKFKKNLHKDVRVITYGKNNTNDYVISKIITQDFTSRFTVHRNGQEMGVFELSVPGEHNATNALSAIALLTEIGIEKSKIRSGIAAFEGSKRRLEMIGYTDGGALLIDDYGHHPNEIKATILTLKNAYPKKKIVCIFQPHTYSRTKALLLEFGAVFKLVDKLLLLPVFKSQRDTENDTISQEEYISAHSTHADTQFIEKFEDVVEYIKKNCASDEFVVLTIGAGDVYKIAYSLKK